METFKGSELSDWELRFESLLSESNAKLLRGIEALLQGHEARLSWRSEAGHRRSIRYMTVYI